VPYPRRKRVEAMLRGARIPARWVPAPSAADIRTADNDRMMAALLAPVELTDEDRALAIRLLAERSPEDIAAALVQIHRARLPEPEDLMSGNDAGPPAQREPRPGFEQSTWMRLNFGRDQNADPRWILPLLCRRGHVSRSEIGAIRITAQETLFEVPTAIAARFMDAVRRTAEDADEFEITPMDGAPREEARRHRREGKPNHAPKPYRQAGRPEAPKKPHRKGTWRAKPDRAK
jgi:ATP-dependent RNA helicase DeaD